MGHVAHMNEYYYTFKPCNQSKTGAATEKLPRGFHARTDESQALFGVLRGTLDPMRLKRNVKDNNLPYLACMLNGDVCVC